MATPIVALVTDFGSADGYAGAMKGVLAERSPEARIVDVTHDVPPGDVAAAAWILASVWDAFPAGTVFLCVVDPGVGTARKAVAISAGGRFGVGPDNGVFTLVAREGASAVLLTRSEHWRSPVSPVFHGRDVFAPVAAALANGTPLHEVGESLPLLVGLPLAEEERLPGGGVGGHVLHVDRFGNLVTDIRERSLPPPPFRVRVGRRLVRRFVRTYGEGTPGEIVALVNSAGHLEIARSGGSAAESLRAVRGTPVVVRPEGAAAASDAAARRRAPASRVRPRASAPRARGRA